MSYPDEEVLLLIRELVSKLTDFQEGSNLFNHVESYIINCVHNADSMVFLKKKDIDCNITSLSDKFIFHGFSAQATDLQRHYENFLPNTTAKPELEIKINVMKFLLCLSESPTSKFLENPEVFSVVEEEEDIDWPAYLKEGVERWSPPPENTSESWSEDSKSDITFYDSPTLTPKNTKIVLVDQINTKENNIVNTKLLKNSLLKVIQSDWFFKDRVCMRPESTNIDANIAICWEDFVEDSVQGLISIKRSNIISEYCVLREIIWQCWILHNSFVFQFVKDQLLPKENVTIASVRPMAFHTFLHEFVPYIDLLQEFRTFHESIFDESQSSPAPDTYRSYNNSLWNFTQPLFQELIRLEKQILSQDTTVTLLKLANEFKFIFRNVNVLKVIHDGVVLDFRSNDPVRCATTLLSCLHRGLLHCVSKMELDIYLTLYLESLFKYLTIINIWLGNDTLIDVFDEFIIQQKNTVTSVTVDVTDFSYTSVMTENVMDYDQFDWQMGFEIKELDDTCKDDGIFQLIFTEVLQIGKNVHFLRLLKKLYLLGDTSNTESLYEELINGVLGEISSYFEYEDDDTIKNEITPGNEEFPYRFASICPDYCKYSTEMDKLENLVDTSDGFLITSFRDLFGAPIKEDSTKNATLYEEISKITKNIYPAKQMVETVFCRILRDRYSESGYLVKNLLIVDFQMQKHLELLRHLFLFQDDLIFPLYRRLFIQIIDHGHFGNDIWLTTQLHDIMLDFYPEFYEKCVVKVDGTAQNLQDPLEACELIEIRYVIEWPVNLIIREKHLEMYSELFHLILKVKWALYILNHLYFNEIEPENSKIQSKIAILFLRRLKIFRFNLLNEFSKIQHYILGYVFGKSLGKFEKDFEAAHNLDTLISSHSNFINSLYSTAVYFRDLHDKSHGFHLLLYMVRKLDIMWRNAKNVNEKELLKYEEMFLKCRDNLDPVMFPRNLTDI